MQGFGEGHFPSLDPYSTGLLRHECALGGAVRDGPTVVVFGPRRTRVGRSIGKVVWAAVLCVKISGGFAAPCRVVGPIGLFACMAVVP